MLLSKSRHAFCDHYIGPDGRIFLSDRQPYRYKAFGDNTAYSVIDGDSLFNIAGRHFRMWTRPAGLWWIIADFQPVPILDPTVRLMAGTIIVLPSPYAVETYIFAEDRRTESQL